MLKQKTELTKRHFRLRAVVHGIFGFRPYAQKLARMLTYRAQTRNIHIGLKRNDNPGEGKEMMNLQVKERVDGRTSCVNSGFINEV
jgi:hypothetical protein